MKSRRRLPMLTCVLPLLVSLLMASPADANAAEKKAQGAAEFLDNVQTGDPGFQSMGQLNFGPNGLLLVADPRAAAVVAIDTGDLGPVKKLKKRIDKVDDLAASAMGAPAGGVNIIGMAVNPLSGRIYLSVQRSADKRFAILTVDDEGNVANFDVKKLRFARVELPGGEKSKISAISGVAVAKDRILAAAHCNEEFRSKLYSIPLPLKHGSSANIYSAETYHVAHRRWETRAPIRSFIPYQQGGRNYIVGSFSCTPIAKFPLDDLKSGAKVKGESVVELGSGNQPLDMFTYEKDGKKWVVTNTYRFHFKKNLFGPSKW